MPETKTITGKVGSTHKSLTSSGTLYQVVQIRNPEGGIIRVQGLKTPTGPKFEVSFHGSDALCSWIAKLPATQKSQAGTGAMYALAMCRQEKNGTGDHVRFQIPGPALNREWGAVFVAHSPELYATLGYAQADATPAPVPTPDDDTDTDDDGEDD